MSNRFMTEGELTQLLSKASMMTRMAPEKDVIILVDGRQFLCCDTRELREELTGISSDCKPSLYINGDGDTTINFDNPSVEVLETARKKLFVVGYDPTGMAVRDLDDAIAKAKV